MRALPFGLVLVFLLGCGGSSPPTTPTESTASGGESASPDGGWADEGWGDAGTSGAGAEAHVSALEAIGVSGPETPWAEMGEYDREMYMVGKVLPIMQELFARQDPTRWNGLDCDTCHGDDMREVGFQMPPASAFSVPAPGTPAWAAMERTAGDTVRFMREEVTPTMGTLLGIDGFTCRGCHPAR